MDLRRIIREEIQVKEGDFVFNILGNQYVIVRDNELKPYAYFDENGNLVGRTSITDTEYEQLEGFLNSIGIDVRRFNYYEARDGGERTVGSMRIKMRDEALKNYIDIMGGNVDLP